MLHEYYGNNEAILGDEAGMHIRVEFLQQAYSHVDWRKSVGYGVEIDSIEDFRIRKGNNRNEIRNKLVIDNIDILLYHYIGNYIFQLV